MDRIRVPATPGGPASASRRHGLQLLAWAALFGALAGALSQLAAPALNTLPGVSLVAPVVILGLAAALLLRLLGAARQTVPPGWLGAAGATFGVVAVLAYYGYYLAALALGAGPPGTNWLAWPDPLSYLWGFFRHDMRRLLGPAALAGLALGLIGPPALGHLRGRAAAPPTRQP